MAHDARQWTFLILAAALAMMFRHVLGEEPATQKPARAILERVAVDLILIDVEARDASGRPLRGLTEEDFEVRVNGVSRPIYSADDRCGCRETPDSSGEPISKGTGGITATLVSHDPTGTIGGEGTREPARFILYFDFALMDLAGRPTAIEAARRWITQTMRDEDRVTIVGSTFALGAVTLAERTSDRSTLLSALQTMEASREFVDPHFAFLPTLECSRDRADDGGRRITLPNCNINAMDDYVHTRGTLKTLAYYLESLDPEERKHLILFHEIAPFRPADLYPGARLRETQEPAAEMVGAAAVASRVTIHAAGTHGAELVGQLMAEYTGGTWNRGPSDLQRMLTEARDRCECLYRLGIEPREKEKSRILTITVRAHNRSVANLRTQVRTGTDRWAQKARSVLSNPSAARDLPVHAALVPVKAAAGGWTMKVQVALHASALARLPTSRGTQAEWEVGARLAREGSQDAWDMLATSTMTATPEATGPDWLVHEHTFANLPAGTYRLGAFVRDRSVDLFGGASSMLELPDPGAQAAVGPIALLAGRRILTSNLPLTAPTSAAARRGVSRSSGLVPSGDAVSEEEGGPPLEIMTWLCGPGVSPSPGAAVERSLRFENEVAMTFPVEAEWDDAGVCVRLTDTVEPGLLDDDGYQYHLRWNRPGKDTPIEMEVDLP